MRGLPETEPGQVAELRAAYEAAQRQGSPDTTQACVRLVWGLVHSARPEDARQGLQLAHALLETSEVDEENRRALAYFSAVAEYNLGRHLAARKRLRELLEAAPHQLQAQNLLDMVEDSIVKEGVVGIGVVTALAAVGGIAAAILSRR